MLLICLTISFYAASVCSGLELEHFKDVTSEFQGRSVFGVGPINMLFPQPLDIDTATRACAEKCLKTKYYCEAFSISGDSSICQMSKWVVSIPHGPTTEAIRRVYKLNGISSGKLRDKSLMDRFTNEDAEDLFLAYGILQRNLRFHKAFLHVCKHAMSNGRLFTRENLLAWRSKSPPTESEIPLSDFKASLSRDVRRDLAGLIYYQAGLNWFSSYSKAILSFLEMFSHSISTGIDIMYDIRRDLLILDTKKEKIVVTMLKNNLYGVLRGFKENPRHVEVYLPTPIPAAELRELLNRYETEQLNTPLLFSADSFLVAMNPMVSGLWAINTVASFLLDEEPGTIHLQTPEGVFYHDLVAAVVLKVLEREQDEFESFQTNMLQKVNKGNFNDIDII